MKSRSALLALCALVLFFACEKSPGGPRDHIRDLTECTVPPGAVQVQDQLEGSESWSFHATIVMDSDQLPRFMESCGSRVEELRRPYAHEALTPEPRPRWWQLPGADAVAGVQHGARHILIVERDTDIAAFLVSGG